MTNPSTEKKPCCPKCIRWIDLGVHNDVESCHNERCECHTPTKKGWPSIFLNAGTEELGLDCSVLVSTVSKIISASRADLLKEIENGTKGLLGKRVEYITADKALNTEFDIALNAVLTLIRSHMKE